MIFHITLSCELLATNVALKGFFFCVNPDVNNKVWSLGEGLVTTFERASERLGSKMEMQMSLQSALS